MLATDPLFSDDSAGRCNLRKLFRQANEADLLSGGSAYFKYHKVMQKLSEFYRVPLQAVVETFAATSPNNDYVGNLRSTVSLLWWHSSGRVGDYTLTTYKACGRRSEGYLSGEVSFIDTVKGEKITCFRENLLDPGKSKRVTVDGHMIAAYLGQSMTMKEANLAFRGKRGAYRIIEKSVQTVAREKRLIPHQMQAIIWMTRKRVLKIKATNQISMFHKDDIHRVQWEPEELTPISLSSQEMEKWQNFVTLRRKELGPRTAPSSLH